VPLREILASKQESVKVDRANQYPNLGLYSYGRGPFVKPPIKGTATSAPKLFRVHTGQFIYSKLFAFEGAFAVVPPEMDGWFVSNEYPTFEVDSAQISPEYLRIAICRPRVWQELATLTVGMGHRRQRLKPDALLEYEIDLPPLYEQHSIVRAVQAADVASARGRMVLELAKSCLDALREEQLVSHGDWRSADDRKIASLAEVCDVRLGFTKGRKLSGATDQAPYLRAANVQDGYIRIADVAEIEACAADFEKYSLQVDDILLLEGGNADHVGRAWIWDGAIAPCLHQNSTMRARVIDPSVCDARFVAWALGASPARTYCFEEAAQTSGVAHLGLAGARAIPIPVPPLREQRVIAAQLDVAREALVAAVRKVEQLQGLRAALVEALVLGEHRLPVIRRSHRRVVVAS
jgi:type I restriction enzyme S subunit